MARVDAQQSSSNQADTIGGKALEEDILAAAPVPQLSLHKRPSWGCSEVRQFLSCCVPDTGLALAELEEGGDARTPPTPSQQRKESIETPTPPKSTLCTLVSGPGLPLS